MKPVIVDANLLLLLVVGTAGSHYIARFKRLQSYSAFHFDTLIEFLRRHPQIVVTPLSLTEVWNIIGERKGDWDRRHDDYIGSALSLIQRSTEVHTPAADLVESREIAYLGLSDVAQIDAAKDKNGLLLSKDGRLCHAARLKGVEAQSFWGLDGIL